MATGFIWPQAGEGPTWPKQHGQEEGGRGHFDLIYILKDDSGYSVENELWIVQEARGSIWRLLKSQGEG